MKKLISLIFLMMFFALSACASGVESKNSNSNSITGEKKMKITITINGTTMNAVLNDNSSSRALYELLQNGSITINMRDYGGMEKVGNLPKSLPRNDTPTDTDAGDLILYQGRAFVIYYDTNSWNFTPLGKIEGVSKSELKKILGSGSVTTILAIGE
ncbi:cyclophilin-like fold protein [Treponema sp. JC4]|uniref:cyclophilin-like fold protein n=1 Tax=Treponema sp. JC4 TaxID=1124982 RepID=UPI001ED976AD|nr:cyclophilin-like fold protein [Treponema sp. JC4]